MTALVEISAQDSVPGDIVRLLDRDGALIAGDLLPAEQIDQIIAETAPVIDRSAEGRDDFTGRLTKRTGALVARSPASHAAIAHAVVLAAATEYLTRHCARIQLHLTQTITILPGQGAQPLHRDRLAWGGYLPDSIEPQFNTLWALTDFTAANGATNVVPGSHRWPPDRRAEPAEAVQAEMPKGSVLVYSGTVVHGGGENRSGQPRTGMNLTYCLSWLRQEENQFLSCPPEIAKALPSELTDLLGYTMANYALGYYSSPELIEGTPDTMAPEAALGRRRGTKLDSAVLTGSG
ncbi:MAG: phytanoyl-CoA dioxygenase family protein [Acidimicrobiia bacterium]|nr:phytanoyl-CoA dioxygenase family protein [Acidimicrobiia bacterium]